MALIARLTALVVTLVLVSSPVPSTGSTGASAPADARPERAGASWRALDVWHFRYRTLPGGRRYPVAITFHGNEVPYPPEGVVVIAATADSAVVQVKDDEQQSGLGRLVELPASGEAGRRLDPA